MQATMKRKLAIGTTVLAAGALGGGAYAASSSGGNPRQEFLGDVAKRLNVSRAQLQDALKGAYVDQLAAAVRAGRLTQAQADAVKRQMARRGVPPLGLGGPGLHRRFFFGGPPGAVHRHGRLSAAATYLGLTETQLLHRLGAGKSLAQIAGEQRKSVSGLKNALKAAAKTRLDRAVAAKWLTSAQEQDILKRLSSRLDQIVNRTGVGGPHGPRGWGSRAGKHVFPALPLAPGNATDPGGPGGPGGAGGPGAPGGAGGPGGASGPDGPPPVTY